MATGRTGFRKDQPTLQSNPTPLPPNIPKLPEKLRRLIGEEEAQKYDEAWQRFFREQKTIG